MGHLLQLILKSSLKFQRMDKTLAEWNLSYSLIEFQRLLKISDLSVLEITSRDTLMRKVISIELSTDSWHKEVTLLIIMALVADQSMARNLLMSHLD